MLKRVCCFLNLPYQNPPTKIHLEALSLLLVEKKIWGLTLLYKRTLSNKNLVLVLLALKFKSLSHGRLGWRSTCKYLGKIFIFMWNKRKILPPGFVTEKFVFGTKTVVWTCCCHLFSSHSSFYLKFGEENHYHLQSSWAMFKCLLKMPGENSQLWHLMSTANGSMTFDWLPGWYVCVSHQWLLYLIWIWFGFFFLWSLLNWFLASLFGNCAEALQSGHKIGTMLSN